MHQGIPTIAGDIWIAIQIPPRLEQRMRIVSSSSSLAEIVYQWVGRQLRALRYAGQIEACIEAPVGVMTLLRASGDEISERLDLGFGHLRITLKIPFNIEQRVRRSALAPTKLKVMRQRVDAACGDIGVGAEIVALVEQQTKSRGVN